MTGRGPFADLYPQADFHRDFLYTPIPTTERHPLKEERGLLKGRRELFSSSRVLSDKTADPDFQPQGPGRFLECLAGLYMLAKAKNTSRTTVPVTLSTIVAQMWQHCSHVFRSSRAKDTHPRVTHSTLGTRVWSNSKAIRSAILAPKILDKIRGTFGPGPLVRPIASTPARHTQGQPGRTGCCRRCGAEPAGTGRYRRPFHCPPCWAHVPHDALGNWMPAQLWNCRLLLKILCVGHKRLQPDQEQQLARSRRRCAVACRPFTSPPWPQICASHPQYSKFQLLGKRNSAP